MPSFGDLFIESKGQPIIYQGHNLVIADKFPVADRDKLKISIEKTNSHYVQGLTVDITGSCEIMGEVKKKGKGVKMVFWEDSTMLDPKNIIIVVFTKIGFIRVQNIWETTDHRGKKSIDSGHNGAAMIVEEIENGRRYHCNDGVPDDDFDDIVFTIQKLTDANQ